MSATRRTLTANMKSDGANASGRASEPKIDDLVAIFALDQCGRQPFFEGWARIDGKCPRPHHFRVRLLGEKTTCVRFVNPDWQIEPERSCALLREFWRENIAPPSIEEFFPETSEQRGEPS